MTSFPRIQLRYRFYISLVCPKISQEQRFFFIFIRYNTKQNCLAMEDEERQRICDYCDTSVALVYCKADSAKLCLACDKEVHVTNQLFSKHFRSLLCDSCHDSPSSVFCETERSVLCQNCDWQHHTTASSSSLHSRRPFEGFSGCPSVPELLSILSLDDLTSEAELPWETPEFVSLNDLIVSGGSDTHNFKAMDVPPLPKNRHATCGKHKDEMIRQLRELARSEPTCLKFEDIDVGFQFLSPDLFPTLELVTKFSSDCCFECQFSNANVSILKESEMKWLDQQDDDFPYGSLLRNLSESDEKPENVNPDSSVMVPVCTSTRSNHEISNSLERNSALSRYKEKKKSRRYEKHIRYESRKVRAETRTRIRGRFAKAAP